VDFGPVHGAIEAGYEPQIEPAAVVHYRLHWRPGRVLGRGFVDGQAGPALYVRHRSVGIQPPTAAEVRQRYRHMARGAMTDVWSATTRVNWLYELGCCVGRTDASVRHGVRYL